MFSHCNISLSFLNIEPIENLSGSLEAVCNATLKIDYFRVHVVISWIKRQRLVCRPDLR